MSMVRVVSNLPFEREARKVFCVGDVGRAGHVDPRLHIVFVFVLAAAAVVVVVVIAIVIAIVIVIVIVITVVGVRWW